MTLAQGKTVGQVCKPIGVTEQTYYRWRKEYGGLRMDQAKRLKTLEKEKARLKKLVAYAGGSKAGLRRKSYQGMSSTKSAYAVRNLATNWFLS